MQRDDKLVMMANHIAKNLAIQGEARAIAAIADHIARFWDPRMRRELLRWQDEHAGEGLKDSVRDAIAAHRDRLLGGV